MNTLDIQMRLLDVIELREATAIKMQNNSCVELVKRYRELDKEMNDLIKDLGNGQTKNTDKQISLGGLLIETQEDIKDIKKSVAILQKQTEKRVINLGGITITSGSEGTEPYTDKKKNIEVAQTELGKIHADFIKNGVLSHQEEIKKEAAFKAENERMYNEIKKLGEVHARVYKEGNFINAIVDELEEMNKRIAALEGQAQKQPTVEELANKIQSLRSKASHKTL